MSRRPKFNPTKPKETKQKRASALVYRADGVTLAVLSDRPEFSLAELQKLVGGYIEQIPGSLGAGYCNEDGRRLNLPVNWNASHRFGTLLVGDVVEIDRGGLALGARDIMRIGGAL